ncbi:MAG: hypothetical protein GX075_03835 [Firmicutes bacterium]|nr:hypothetical protein [Bacillota bacterium]
MEREIKMKKIPILLLFLVLISQGCIADNDSSFIIEVGNKPNQLGYTVGVELSSGPIAITEFEDEVLILDKVNYKVNIYSTSGKFVTYKKIPKELVYKDIAVNPRNKDIMLLTDKGIFAIKDDKVNKIYDLPNIISLPYYFYIDKYGTIGITGLNDEGRLKSGIYNSEGVYTELKGVSVFLSYSGMRCLQTTNKEVVLTEREKFIKRFTINIQGFMTPIGISDDMSIYCVEPIKNGIILYRIDKNGKMINKKINYSSRLIGDPADIIRFIRVTQKSEIIGLEVNPKECRVLKIKI